MLKVYARIGGAFQFKKRGFLTRLKQANNEHEPYRAL